MGGACATFHSPASDATILNEFWLKWNSVDLNTCLIRLIDNTWMSGEHCTSVNQAEWNSGGWGWSPDGPLHFCLDHSWVEHWNVDKFFVDIGVSFSCIYVDCMHIATSYCACSSAKQIFSDPPLVCSGDATGAKHSTEEEEWRTEEMWGRTEEKLGRTEAMWGGLRSSGGTEAMWGRTEAMWGRTEEKWGRTEEKFGRTEENWGRTEAMWTLVHSVYNICSFIYYRHCCEVLVYESTSWPYRPSTIE